MHGATTISSVLQNSDLGVADVSQAATNRHIVVEVDIFVGKEDNTK
jgi:hypothetical protein